MLKTHPTNKQTSKRYIFSKTWPLKPAKQTNNKKQTQLFLETWPPWPILGWSSSMSSSTLETILSINQYQYTFSIQMSMSQTEIYHLVYSVDFRHLIHWNRSALVGIPFLAIVIIFTNNEDYITVFTHFPTKYLKSAGCNLNVEMHFSTLQRFCKCVARLL